MPPTDAGACGYGLENAAAAAAAYFRGPPRSRYVMSFETGEPDPTDRAAPCNVGLVTCFGPYL